MARPKSLTDEEKKAKGTFRKHKKHGPVPTREPINSELPRNLAGNAEAGTMWRFLMRPNVCERGWFAEHDKPLLIMFCQTWALYCKATEECMSWGNIDDDGKLAPWARQRQALADQLLQQIKVMGLNPRDSKAIKIDESQKQVNQGKPALTRPQIFTPPPEAS